jgi:hypothetical protein
VSLVFPADPAVSSDWAVAKGREGVMSSPAVRIVQRFTARIDSDLDRSRLSA